MGGGGDEEMKRYTFEVVIDEGNDEFWESIKKIKGIPAVKDDLINTLEAFGVYTNGRDLHVKFKKFETISGRPYKPRKSKKGKSK